MFCTAPAIRSVTHNVLTEAICTFVLILGVPTALVLARTRGRWASAARPLVTGPMVLPPVVAGLALLTTLGRRGLVGQHLSALGIEIGFTTTAVVIAQTFVALPFLVVSLEGALRSSGQDYERAATYLGASPTRTLLTVTLPMAAPALASGTALSFARALGEFGPVWWDDGEPDFNRHMARTTAYADWYRDPGS